MRPLAMLSKLLPGKFKITGTMDKKQTLELLKTMAKELPPNIYGNAVNMLKLEGEKHSYDRGFTLGVNDLAQFDKARNSIVNNLERRLKGAKTNADVSKLSGIYNKKIDEMLKKRLDNKDNPLYDMIASGAKGSATQLRSIMATPLMVTDAKGKIVPKPIRKSYTEGLDLEDYWTSMYGARRGMMDRALQTSEPGAFSKDIMATTVDNVISGEDCGTKEGVILKVNDQDALDRFLAGNQGPLAHNTLVDGKAVSTLQKAGFQTVKVRSPLRCLRPRGTCAKCYGLDEHGSTPEIGDNVGAKAGQTIAEPMMQMTMNSFHTGGTAGSGGGYARIKQILTMPKVVVGAATLAPMDGKVSAIKKGLAGGFDITVGTMTVHVSKGLNLKVKEGQTIEAGDPLSEGVIRPQDLVKHKGMHAAQEYISKELQDAYKNQGIGISRKTFETIVRSVGNTTKVMSSSPDHDHLPGDIIPYTVATDHNQNLTIKTTLANAVGRKLAEASAEFRVGHELEPKDIIILRSKGINEVMIQKDPIVHAPVLKGISTLPLLRRDWMAALGYRYLAKNLVEGAGQAWTTDLSDYHPIPAFAYGATFGKGKEGKY